MSENNPLSLLYEVRKDALAKAKGMEVDERFWSMIYHMGRMIQETQKEGLLALDERIKTVPAQIGFGQDMQLAALYVCDALDAEVITEMLTARYWVKDLQGKDALLYFMMILSFLKIQDGSSRYVLENLLLAYLPDDAWEQFAAFKKADTGTAAAQYQCQCWKRRNPLYETTAGNKDRTGRQDIIEKSYQGRAESLFCHIAERAVQFCQEEAVLCHTGTSGRGVCAGGSVHGACPTA